MEMELQAYLVQFFLNEMGNKRKKIWEIKRRKHLRNSSQLHTFSFFKCKFWEIEVFRLENYQNIAILGSVLHTLLKLKNMGIFFFFFKIKKKKKKKIILFNFIFFSQKKPIDADVWKWNARRPETIYLFLLALKCQLMT